MNKQTSIEQPLIFAVLSGKGGVGKSITSVNTADMLHKMGYSVALIDADLGLSNCATLMNEPVNASVAQWVNGECSLEDLPQNCDGITLVTGSNEPGQTVQTEWMMDALDQVTFDLEENHQFIIIDTPAGAGEMTLWALDRADLGVLVLVEEPTAISDVYRLCKYIYAIDPEYRFASIVNLAENKAAADSTIERFNTILNYFLQKQTSYLGFIPASDSVKNAVRYQSRLLQSATDTSVVDELKFIAQNIVGFANENSNQLLTSVK